jgi:hypothetical protein
VCRSSPGSLPCARRRSGVGPILTGDVCIGGRAPHPSEVQRSGDEDFQWDVLPLRWQTYLNSGYPDDRNDGALWEGRGVSTGLSGGVRVRWKFFSAGFAPLVAWQQNRDFFFMRP